TSGLLESLECEGSVRAAEAEGIGDRDLDLRFARFVRRVVEVALRILIVDIDGRRNDLLAERENREDRLGRAGRADHVTGRGLRRADRELLRVVAERGLDRE